MNKLDKYSFNLATLEDSDNILKVRNQPETRASAFNKHVISIHEHNQWFEKQLKSNFFHYYILKNKSNSFIGLGYADKFDQNDKSCYWGFRILSDIPKEDKYGSIVKYLLFEKLFEFQNIDKLYSQVLKDHEWIKDWHIRWGNELINYDSKKECYNLVIYKDKWKAIKNKILKKINENS